MSSRRRSTIGGFAVFVVASTAALAAEPALTIKTRIAEITVTIAEQLKKHPGLAEICLAEGRVWAEKSKVQAETEVKKDPALFKPGRRWTYDRVYEFRSLVGNRYVSIVRSDGTYLNGAHPNEEINTLLWDRDAKKWISIRAFFNETADNGPTMTAIAKLARRAVVAEKLVRARQAAPDDEKKKPQQPLDQAVAQDDWVVKGVLPTLLKVGPITFAPSTIAGKSSGLTFHYSPYEVDAYAAGTYTVFVPWNAIKTYLSPEGIAVFGGDRPPGDADQ